MCVCVYHEGLCHPKAIPLSALILRQVWRVGRKLLSVETSGCVCGCVAVYVCVCVCALLRFLHFVLHSESCLVNVLFFVNYEFVYNIFCVFVCMLRLYISVFKNNNF